ncbi:predicted protein [Naegleria gruberi]|uniref:Predicted protein n=1 Tax=Naegleria gruberi TaxID=5762 RepID=D2VA33_NAEGR|nr:uncharacterized protein NAEGRDRAFT_65722 [Naegleria gruberi]EFC46238.1 predicted protein [Naegleria gruberi]|eukprot:XP_002678982.1 predicted protein [Naegleria gruberi strain NEG-M]
MSGRGVAFEDEDRGVGIGTNSLLDNYSSSSMGVGNDDNQLMNEQQQQQQENNYSNVGNNAKSFLGSDEDDDDGFYDSLFYEDIESRLWENDSSYLIAVSPKIFENSRIRMKVILGYRVQSVVHALPSPNSMDGSAVAGHLLPYDRYNRRRLYQSYYNRDRIERMSPEEFNQLPEYQQRRILKERFLNKRMEQRRGLKDSLSENMYGPSSSSNGNYSNSSLGNFMYWATRNLDQLGWKSLLGVVAFVFGLYRTVSP